MFRRDDSELIYKEKPLVGINGWLLVLCIFLFGRSNATLIQLIDNTTSLLPYYRIAHFSVWIIPAIRDLLAAIFMIAGIYIAISLLRINKKALVYAKVYFMAIIIQDVIIFGYYAYATYNVKTEPQYVSYYILNFIIATIWLTYLYRSKRVIATYSEDLQPGISDRKVLIIFLLASSVMLITAKIDNQWYKAAIQLAFSLYVLIYYTKHLDLAKSGDLRSKELVQSMGWPLVILFLFMFIRGCSSLF